jgi:hypothetical protein
VPIIITPRHLTLSLSATHTRTSDSFPLCRLGTSSVSTSSQLAFLSALGHPHLPLLSLPDLTSPHPHLTKAPRSVRPKSITQARNLSLVLTFPLLINVITTSVHHQTQSNGRSSLARIIQPLPLPAHLSCLACPVVAPPAHCAPSLPLAYTIRVEQLASQPASQPALSFCVTKLQSMQVLLAPSQPPTLVQA